MAYTTIDDPSVYFQTALYASTGNGANITVTNDGNSDLQPDWLWIKVRDGTNNHDTFDSSRGITSKRLFPNLTNAENDSGIDSVSSDGFTTGTSIGNINNTSGANTYVAWQWKANGGTTASNTDGSITSTVQANTTAGFSIVTYTGNGSSGATIGHGLGAVPSMFIIKRRSGTEDWVVYHHKNTSAPETDHLLLNTTDATSDSDTRFNDTAPTSSLITMGNNAVINASGSTYVGYCFAEKQGYSKFGSYTGNANADGPFIYTGFKPTWLLIRNTKAGEGWMLHDAKVDEEGGNGTAGNPRERRFQINETQAEVGTTTAFDFVSNGFKLRTDTGSHN